MLEILKGFIVTYEDYCLFMTENFSFINPQTEIGFLIYVLTLILLFNIFKFFLTYILEIIKLLKSLLTRRRYF